MADLYKTGIRPLVDDYLEAKSKEVRSYGDYWSASSAGYCMRKLIFERLKIPQVNKDSRKTRVFEAGHIFHEWMQRITKQSGMSIAQEVELIDDKLMIKGHFDDLVLVESYEGLDLSKLKFSPNAKILPNSSNLILYDYKTQNSRAFTWQKDKPMSHFHRMQLGTYMYMLRNRKYGKLKTDWNGANFLSEYPMNLLTEARILKISKDDLRMTEDQLMWTPQLEKEVYSYWSTLNGYWKAKTIPNCTCADHENGFMAKEAYNPFWFDGEPCSLKWYEMNKEK